MSQNPIADYSDVGPVYPIEYRCPVLTGIKSQCGEPTVVVVRDSDGDASFYCMRHFLLRVRGEREQQAETESIVAEVPPPRKPKVGDIVHFQLLSVSPDGAKERPALVIGHDSLEGRLHLRGFFGPTDATPGHSEADTFFANYGHYPGDWHWPEEDGLWM